jgi:hypothetical protein
LKFKGETSLQADEYKVVSNSTEFTVNTFPVANRSSKLIIESKYIDNNLSLIFISDRVSSLLKTYIWTRKTADEPKLNLHSTYDLNALNLESGAKNTAIYIFDLLLNQDKLYISLVEIAQNTTDCDTFKVIEIEVLGNELIFKKANEIWRSSTCTKSFPNNPGWNDFHGRLLATSNHIYLTTGLLIASTYQGVYPNPNMNNIGSDLYAEIEKVEFLGESFKLID